MANQPKPNDLSYSTTIFLPLCSYLNLSFSHNQFIFSTIPINSPLFALIEISYSGKSDYEFTHQKSIDIYKYLCGEGLRK